jgi:hypothetical protein
MTTETLIQKVRDEVGTLDANGEQLLIKAMKILQGAGDTIKPQPAEEHFVSQNITPEEYEALPRAERRHYQDEAEELNQRWVENQLKRYNAKWIMVIDGQVVMHGATLDDYPEEEDFLALCEKTGKYPFVFLSPSVFAIEESSTSWHLTKDAGDAYPALAMTISGNNRRLETEADLDTGASDCYCDLELLTANRVVKLYSNNFEKTSRHLSQPFIYFTKQLSLEIRDKTRASRQWRTTVICVDDWQNSPFIAINPKRTFLLGRRVLFKLRPRIILDFDARLTEVEFKQTPA